LVDSEWRSGIPAVRNTTLETHTGNHFNAWKNTVVNADTMTWRREILLKNRLVGGWTVSASCCADSGKGVRLFTARKIEKAATTMLVNGQIEEF
jgi:hypothetical protein